MSLDLADVLPRGAAMARARQIGLFGVIMVVSGMRLARPASPPLVTYAIEYLASDARLHVTVSVSGLGASDTSLIAALPTWGDWDRPDIPYVLAARLDGRPAAPDSSGAVSLPATAITNGRVTLSYELPVLTIGSPAAVIHPLLPRGDSLHAVAFVRNTMVGFRRANGTPLELRTVVRLLSDGRRGTYSGWAGYARGTQSSAAPNPIDEDNGVFVLGAVGPPLARMIGSTRIEVLPTTEDSRPAEEVMTILASVVPVLQRATGVVPSTMVRMVIGDSHAEGVARGTATLSGTYVALPPTGQLSDPSIELVAHELIHDWLGVRRFHDPGMLWVTEGFTTYLASWAVVAGGLTTEARFAGRMQELADAVLAIPADMLLPLSRDAVRPPEADGEVEDLAYSGGALAGLSIDVALRRRGSSLAGYLGVLLREVHGPVGEPDLRRLATAMGVSEAYALASDSMPDPMPWRALAGAGFRITEEEAALAYLGIEVDPLPLGEWRTLGPAIVRGIDPRGPAVGLPLAAGDTIIVRSPPRGNAPMPGAAAPPRFRFAMSAIPTGERMVTIDLRGGGPPRTVTATPRLISGGVRHAASWPAGGTARFFSPRAQG